MLCFLPLSVSRKSGVAGPVQPPEQWGALYPSQGRCWERLPLCAAVCARRGGEVPWPWQLRVRRLSPSAFLKTVFPPVLKELG